MAVVLVALAACSPAGPGGTVGNGPNGDPVDVTPTPPENAAKGFPAGWQKFEQLNEVTRAENSEIRELYANKAATGAPFPKGSVLVKAHYRMKGVTKGELFQLSVMTKTSGADNGGWTFKAYAPAGAKIDADADVCVMCHTQRRDNDYVFSER